MRVYYDRLGWRGLCHIRQLRAVSAATWMLTLPMGRIPGIPLCNLNFKTCLRKDEMRPSTAQPLQD